MMKPQFWFPMLIVCCFMSFTIGRNFETAAENRKVVERQEKVVQEMKAAADRRHQEVSNSAEREAVGLLRRLIDRPKQPEEDKSTQVSPPVKPIASKTEVKGERFSVGYEQPSTPHRTDDTPKLPYTTDDMIRFSRGLTPQQQQNSNNSARGGRLFGRGR